LPARDETFGRRIERLLPWGTRAAFAKKIGLNKNQLSAYIKGKVPKAPILKRIANGLGVSVDYLLGKDGLPQETTQQVNSVKTADITDLAELIRAVIIESVKKLPMTDQEEFYLNAAIFLEGKISESEEVYRSIQFIKGSYAKRLAIRPYADAELVVKDASGELHRLIFQAKSTSLLSSPTPSSPELSNVAPKAESSSMKGASDAAKPDNEENGVAQEPA
jgi:transcriptional regulator with XRE-family HTH domain